MQKLQNSNLYDILPASFQTVETQCISYALSRAIAFLCEKVDKTQLISNIEHLDDEVLDYLALEYRTQYYDQRLSRNQKIELIKGSLQWYMYAGTKNSIVEMIRAIYTNSAIKEWYEYNGDPYHFIINVTAQGYSSEDVERIFKVVEIAKNARSILDVLNLSFDEKIKRTIKCFALSSHRIDDTLSTAGSRTEHAAGAPKAFITSSKRMNDVIIAEMVIFDGGGLTDDIENVIDGGDSTSLVPTDILDFNY